MRSREANADFLSFLSETEKRVPFTSDAVLGVYTMAI